MLVPLVNHSITFADIVSPIVQRATLYALDLALAGIVQLGRGLLDALVGVEPSGHSVVDAVELLDLLAIQLAGPETTRTGNV